MTMAVFPSRVGDMWFDSRKDRQVPLDESYEFELRPLVMEMAEMARRDIYLKVPKP